MKQLNRIGPVLGTLLLLALGANMPRLASAALDHSLGQELIQRENGSASLALATKTDFFQTLQIFQSRYAQVELPEGYHLTAQEAEAAAIEAVLELGMSGTVYETPEVTPVLLTSKEGADLSGVFWHCAWVGTDGAPEVLWLDDQSGTMVSFQLKVGSTMTYVSKDIVPDEVVETAEFCRLNYPVDNAILAFETAGKTDSYYKLTLTQEEEALNHTLFLRWSPGWLYFNI